MLSVPRRGMARKAFGRMLPYAAVTHRSGDISRSAARNASWADATRRAGVGDDSWRSTCSAETHCALPVAAGYGPELPKPWQLARARLGSYTRSRLGNRGRNPRQRTSRALAGVRMRSGSMPRSAAAAATGEGLAPLPRPRRRPGCVTTAATCGEPREREACGGA